MSGTKAGGIKASQTNRELHGEDFYKIIGHKGGIKKCKKGFACNRDLARIAGAIGGHISKRGAKKWKIY